MFNMLWREANEALTRNAWNRQFGANYCYGPAMGQDLSEPETKKSTTFIENDTVRVGASCMQGYRKRMEDCHTVILSFPEDPKMSYFGIFDGHGSENIAKYAADNLHKVIINRPEYAKGNIRAAIAEGFKELDNNLRKADFNIFQAGSTANIIIIRDNTLYCANIGDSRSVASSKCRAVDLSDDHKPGNPFELRRILHAGGYVEMNRVNGNLALSRAFGDFVYKKNRRLKSDEQIVIACPDITEVQVNCDLDFVVMASDGIWNVMSSKEVVDFTRAGLKNKISPDKICEQLLHACLAPTGHLATAMGFDNMTVVILEFLHKI